MAGATEVKENDGWSAVRRRQIVFRDPFRQCRLALTEFLRPPHRLALLAFAMLNLRRHALG